MGTSGGGRRISSVGRRDCNQQTHEGKLSTHDVSSLDNPVERLSTNDRVERVGRER